MAVLGEAVFDFTARPGGGPFDFEGHPGGSPLNVAVAAARQGQPATVLTQFSTDLFGRHLVEFLAENGVDTALSGRSDDPTALAFVSHDANGNALFQFFANGSADKMWDPQPRPVVPPSVRFMQVSSLTLFSEPSWCTAIDLIRSCADRVGVLFDPTYRPSLIPSRAAFLARLDVLLPSLSFLKPSDQDLEFLYPGRNPYEVCEEWLARGVPAVILTLGAAGARLLRSGREPVVVSTTPVAVLDTVGAGDTFTGTLFAQLVERTAGDATGSRTWRDLSDDEWFAALDWANRSAGINCQRAGCDPPTRAEVAGDTLVR